MQQEISAADRPAIGPIWASRISFPAPKSDALLEIVKKAIVDLGDGDSVEMMKDISTGCTLADVKVEWSGYRSGVGGPKDNNWDEPNISDKEKYKGMMGDARGKTTILYVHGGFC